MVSSSKKAVAQREWRKNNPELARAQYLKHYYVWKAKTPLEKRKAIAREKNRRWREKNKALIKVINRNYYLKRKAQKQAESKLVNNQPNDTAAIA